MEVGPKSSEERGFYIPGEESGATINDIPPELLDFVFSHFDEKDLKSTDLVSKLFNVKSSDRQENLLNQENLMISHFLEAAISNIDKENYPNVIERLNSLLNKNPILKSQSLLQLKENTIDIKKEIAMALAMMELKDLVKLGETIDNENPGLKRGLINLARLYLEKFDLYEGEFDLKENILAGDFKNVEIKGKFKKDPLNYSVRLMYIGTALASIGRMEQAEKYIQKSKDILKDLDLSSKIYAYPLFSLEFCKAGLIDEAIGMAENIFDHKALKKIYNELLSQNKPEEAKKVKEMMKVGR